MSKVYDIELLRELCLAFGPTGCEDNVADIIIGKIKESAHEIRRDLMGNVIAKMSFGNPAKRKRIMVSAHMDEVGFIIKGIKDKKRSLVFEGFTLLLVTILFLLAVI